MFDHSTISRGCYKTLKEISQQFAFDSDYVLHDRGVLRKA